jgi:hypothetical protein
LSSPFQRQGPIPGIVHGANEYVVGVSFIAAPPVLDYASSAATASSIVIGIVVLFAAATTAGLAGLVEGLSLSAHMVLDFVLALALIGVPFIFGFSEETPPTVFFISLGIVHLLITVGTRFERLEP